MPEVVLYREADGRVPFIEWFAERNPRVQEKCIARLAALGHRLRRPEADYLRGGVYELRFSWGRLNYRVLYGSLGTGIALVSHGLTKQEPSVPPPEIDVARQRLARARRDPPIHSFRPPWREDVAPSST